jgi:hypothetical protein
VFGISFSALERGDTMKRHHPRKRVIQYPEASRLSREASEYWYRAFAGYDGSRLSNAVPMRWRDELER